jgi:MoaA/NifB/PqqE/SkfB family radical SAM enzyme
MNWGQIFLDFTNVCNYRCVFCNSYNYDKVVLRLKDFIDFDKLINSATIIDVTGYGELTTHPDFEEIVDRLTQISRKFSLVTNGSLLTEVKSQALLKSSIYLINFSINSLNEDTYRFLTGGMGNLSTTLNNIENFLSHDPSIMCQFFFVINSHNFNELFNFVDYAKGFSGKSTKIRLVLRGLTPTLKYPEGFIVKDTEDNRMFLNKANKYACESGIELETFSFDMNRDEEGRVSGRVKLENIIRTCGVLDTAMFVGPTGNVLPCCWITDSMGNIKEESIESIWTGAIYNDLRNCIKMGDYNKYCKNCRREG